MRSADRVESHSGSDDIGRQVRTLSRRLRVASNSAWNATSAPSAGGRTSTPRELDHRCRTPAVPW